MYIRKERQTIGEVKETCNTKICKARMGRCSSYVVRSCHVCKEPESSTAYSAVAIVKHIKGYHRADLNTRLFHLLFIEIIPSHIMKLQHINKNKTHFQYMSLGDILSCFKDTKQGQSFAISS